MTDQPTPVTDEDCRKAHEWAVTHRAPTVPDEARAAARAIRAHVPAPPATLADELRKLATVLPVERQWLDEIDLLAARVEAVEKENRAALNHAYDERDEALVERDEARAEVDRLAEGRTSNENPPKLESDREHPTHVGALPDPDDVPGGEVWEVLIDGHERTVGFRGHGTTWTCYRENWAEPTTNARKRITLVSRLVPEVTA